MSTNIAVCQLNDRVAPRFDQCDELILITIGDNGTVKEKKILPVTTSKLVEMTRLLTHLKTKALICGGIKQDHEQIFRRTNIEVIDNVIGNIEYVLIRYMRGELKPGDIIPEIYFDPGKGIQEGGDLSRTGPTKDSYGAEKGDAATHHSRLA
jgi:predicted Fe-Mo cluster-binding NifX family protein